MRKLIIALILAFIPTLAVAEEIRVSVNGMVCSFCAQGIKKTFGNLVEVESVSPDLENKLVVIVTKKDQLLTDARIEELIKDSGYEVKKIERKS